jgi:hypothetical protein
MLDHLPPNLSDLLMILALSAVSAIVAIGKRIASGKRPSIIWLCTEFLTAILCGYLMYTAYPALSGYMPEWITPPIAIAIAAHSGGRIIQAVEGSVVSYLERIFIRSS